MPEIPCPLDSVMQTRPGTRGLVTGLGVGDGPESEIMSSKQRVFGQPGSPCSCHTVFSPKTLKLDGCCPVAQSQAEGVQPRQQSTTL